MFHLTREYFDAVTQTRQIGHSTCPKNTGIKSKQPVPHHPEDDEIDLAQLVGVLFRRWPLILFCTLLAVLIGVGYGLTLPSLYSFTSMIQIGQYQTTEEGYKDIQSHGAAAQHLKATAQTVYKKCTNGENTIELGFSLQEDFQVTPSEQGGILEIQRSR